MDIMVALFTFLFGILAIDYMSFKSLQREIEQVKREIEIREERHNDI